MVFSGWLDGRWKLKTPLEDFQFGPWINEVMSDIIQAFLSCFRGTLRWMISGPQLSRWFQTWVSCNLCHLPRWEKYIVWRLQLMFWMVIARYCHVYRHDWTVFQILDWFLALQIFKFMVALCFSMSFHYHVQMIKHFQGCEKTRYWNQGWDHLLLVKLNTPQRGSFLWVSIGHQWCGRRLQHYNDIYRCR